MKSLSLLIKPASAFCNLRCQYCFYRADSDARRECVPVMMSYETMESLVLQALELSEGRISFAFQGGEPMLRGLSFYQFFTDMVRNNLRKGQTAEYSIQTNGTLVNEEWANFFYENNFLVGLSLDGTQELHDLYRVDAAGNGTWSRVERALRILQEHNVETSILSVITGDAARHGKEIYQRLKALECEFLQFIPCLDPLTADRGSQPYSLTPEQYASFLCDIFDLWYKDWERGDYHSVRMFDDYVHLMTGRPAGTCTSTGSCGQYFVVEGDGSMYPCDFFSHDSWCMGTLGKQTLKNLIESPIAKKFQALGCSRPARCRNCQWLSLCSGGCQRERIGLEYSYYCAALQAFFLHAAPYLKIISDAERNMLYGC